MPALTGSTGFPALTKWPPSLETKVSSSLTYSAKVIESPRNITRGDWVCESSGPRSPSALVRILVGRPCRPVRLDQHLSIRAHAHSGWRFDVEAGRKSHIEFELGWIVALLLQPSHEIWVLADRHKFRAGTNRRTTSSPTARASSVDASSSNIFFMREAGVRWVPSGIWARLDSSRIAIRPRTHSRPNRSGAMPGQRPIRVHGAFGNVQRCGSLRDGQTAEQAQFENLGMPRIHRFQTLHALVEADQVRLASMFSAMSGWSVTR